MKPQVWRSVLKLAPEGADRPGQGRAAQGLLARWFKQFQRVPPLWIFNADEAMVYRGPQNKLACAPCRVLPRGQAR
jgi:hypothetical protein